MKILQLCNKIPYPHNDGGAIAVLNLAVSLADHGHEVSILAMNTQKHQSNTRKIPSVLSSKIKFIYVTVDTRIKPWKLLMNLLFSGQPYNATRFYQKVFALKLKELLQSDKFDIVQLEGLYLKPYLELIRAQCKSKIVYRAHNVENEIWEGLASGQKNPIKKIYLRNLANRIKKYETSFINQYDILLPISEVDQLKFHDFGNTKPVHLTYTGIANDDFRSIKDIRLPENLFFIGALDWIPNQEGLVWFMEQVWRPLKNKFPSLEFHVAGRNAPDWLEPKCRIEMVTFHGEVSDAHQFIDDHDIMLVPLFAGSGLRIKIVEAMARSKVIITTHAGAKGLPENQGNEIIITDQAEKWLSQISNLLNKPDAYQSISDRAFLYAKQNFSSEIILTNLLYFYTQEGLC